MASKNRISVYITIALFGASFLLVYYVGKNDQFIESLIKSSGIYAALVTILIYGLLSLTPIPSDPLTILCGALFGPFLGILVSWAGNTFAALVEYIVGKGAATVVDFESKKKKLPWGLDKLPADSSLFLIGGRFIPGFGSKVVSVVAGAYNVSIFKYVWTAGLANIVGSVVYALGGAGLVRFF